MSDFEIHWEVDDSGIMRTLGRLADGPDLDALFEFETGLIDVFIKTQKDVHVDTGSLKNSAFPESRYDNDSEEWVGEFSYGGESHPIPFVDYAQIEQSREGTHNFMRHVDSKTNDNYYIRAIKRYMRRAG